MANSASCSVSQHNRSAIYKYILYSIVTECRVFVGCDPGLVSLSDRDAAQLARNCALNYLHLSILGFGLLMAATMRDEKVNAFD